MQVVIAEIDLDTGIQCRASIDTGTVDEYADAMTASATFPPVDLFGAAGRYWIGDGWHRVLGAKKIGALTIDAIVRDGTRADALRFALGANAAHGQRRTNADKRRCVEIAVREFPALSSRAVAELCSVGHQLVLSVRQVDESPTSHITGADGKQYPARRAVAARPECKTEETLPPVAATKTAAEQSPQAATPAPRRVRATAPCEGMQFARIAILNLEQIRHDDTERAQAFQLVTEWINNAKR